MAPPSFISWFFRFIYSQLFVHIPKPTFDLTGQTILITGSNVGLGLEAARHIARQNPGKIILGVRTVSKGDAAADDISSTTGYPRSQIESWPLDMSDTASIKRFAERTKSLKRLDAAILNAGVLNTKQWIEYNGIESHVSVNVLGTTLLTYLLLPIMEASAQRTGSRGRMSVVGSDMMYLAQESQLKTPGPILDSLKTEDLKLIPTRYELSKLLAFYAIHELAKQRPLSKSNVLVNVMTPGACKSTLFRDDEPLGVTIGFLLFARTTEVGARTLVGAIDTGLPDVAHGLFVMDNQVDLKSRDLLADPYEQELSRKWNGELKAYLESVAPGSTSL